MARGDMLVENATFGSGAEILNRPPYEAVSMTIDFSEAEANGKFKESDTGELYVPAGMPIDKNGGPQNETADDVVGILLYDVFESRPQGAILKKAYINVNRAKKHSGVTSYEDFKEKLPMIVFEEEPGE